MPAKRIEIPFITGLLSSPSRISEVADKIPIEAIDNKYANFIYSLIVRRFEKGKLTDHDVLYRLVHAKNAKGSRRQLESLALKLASSSNPSREGFNYLVESIINAYRKSIMVERLTIAARNLAKGSVSHARREVIKLANELDPRIHEGPIGRLLSDSPKRLKRQLINAQKNGKETRYLTNFEKIDELTGGGKRGDLWLVCAYVSEGKTTFLVELAYRACIEQGKNVVFVSLEMSREEIELLLAIRHAHTIQPGGIDKKKAELGKLNRSDYKTFLKALEDLQGRKKGQLLIWQAPDGLNLKTLKGKLQAIQNEFDIDMVCIDYLELLSPMRRRGQYRIEVTDTIKATQRIAQTFNDGRGVWIVSGHQISRVGKQKANKRGYYLLDDLAETSGAERTANVVLCLLQTERMAKNHEILINMPKNRSGKKMMKGYLLMADWAHGLLTEIQEDNLWDSGLD